MSLEEDLEQCIYDHHEDTLKIPFFGISNLNTTIFKRFLQEKGIECQLLIENRTYFALLIDITTTLKQYKPERSNDLDFNESSPSKGFLQNAYSLLIYLRNLIIICFLTGKLCLPVKNIYFSHLFIIL